MERPEEQGGKVVSFFDELVVRAWVRLTADRKVKLQLTVSGNLASALCQAIVAVHLSVGDRSVKYSVQSSDEQNGSMVTINLEPLTAGDAAVADVVERRDYFTNVERIEIEMRGGECIVFANALYLPTT